MQGKEEDCQIDQILASVMPRSLQIGEYLSLCFVFCVQGKEEDCQIDQILASAMPRSLQIGKYLALLCVFFVWHFYR